MCTEATCHTCQAELGSDWVTCGGKAYCFGCIELIDKAADHLLCKRHQRRIEPPEGEGRWE